MPRPRIVSHDFNVAETANEEFRERLDLLIEELELQQVTTSYPHALHPAADICLVDYCHLGTVDTPALISECFECEHCGGRQHNDSSRTLSGARLCTEGCISAYANNHGFLSVDSDGGRSQWFEIGNCHGQLATYSAANRNGFNTPENHPFLVGMEVEKCDENFHDCSDDSTDILSDALSRGWIAVSDGSLDGDCGFELVSPAYNLTCPDVDYGATDLSDCLSDWAALNAMSDSSCGGHITVSCDGLTGPQLAARLEPLFPVLFALYPSRVSNEYSVATRGRYATETGRKFRAINTMPNRVEFRLFPGVETGPQLANRVGLLSAALQCILGDSGLLCEEEAREELQAAIDNPDSALWAAINCLVSDYLSEKQIEKRTERIVSFTHWYATGELDEITRRYLS